MILGIARKGASTSSFQKGDQERTGVVFYFSSAYIQPPEQVQGKSASSESVSGKSGSKKCVKNVCLKSAPKKCVKNVRLKSAPKKCVLHLAKMHEKVGREVRWYNIVEKEVSQVADVEAKLCSLCSQVCIKVGAC